MNRDPIYLPQAVDRALDEALDAAVSGRGAVVAVAGAAGAGKSTVITEAAFRAVDRHPGLNVATTVCVARAGRGVGATDEAPRASEAAGIPPRGPAPAPDDRPAIGSLVPDDGELWPIMDLLDQLGELGGEERRAQPVPADLRRRILWLVARVAADAAQNLVAPPVLQFGASFVQRVLEFHRAGLPGEGHFEGPERRRQRVLRAWRVAAGRRPVLAVVDDAHFLDAASCELIADLERACRRDALPLLLLVGYREPEARLFHERLAHPLLDVLRDGMAGGRARTITLEPWTFDQVCGYCDARFGAGRLPPGLAEELHLRTGGLPVFLVHVLDLLLANGALTEGEGGRLRLVRPLRDLGVPESVEGVILAQLDQMDADLRPLVERASVEGERFHEAVLHALAPEPRGRAIPECLAAVEAYHGLVRGLGPEPGPPLGIAWRFAHALVQEVAYRRLPGAVRARLHAIVAEALERLAGDDAALLAPRIADHAEVASDLPRAHRWALRAAEDALHRHDGSSALARAEQALRTVAATDPEAPSRTAQARLLRARALQRLGRWDDAAPELAEGARLAEALGLHSDAAEAWIALAHVADVRERLDDAARCAREALRAARAAGDPRLRLAAALAGQRPAAKRPRAEKHAYYVGVLRAEAEAVEAEARRRGDPGLEAHALRWIGRVERSLGDVASALARFERAETLARAAGERLLLIDLHHARMDIEWVSGRREEAVAVGERLVALSRAVGDPVACCGALEALGARLTDLGRHAEAETLYRESLGKARQADLAEHLCIAHARLAHVLEQQGRDEEALRHHGSHLEAAGAIGSRGGVVAATLGLASGDVRHGAPDRALERVAGLGVTAADGADAWFMAAIVRADALAARGPLDAALDALDAARDGWTGDEHAYWSGRLGMRRGEVLGRLGRSREAREAMDDAIAVLDAEHRRWGALEMGLQLERARAARLALGDA